jgi:hypothetical protein
VGIIQKIPITLNFVGSITYVVEASSHEAAITLAEDAFRKVHPRTQLESIFVMDESEIQVLEARGQKYLEIKEDVH